MPFGNGPRVLSSPAAATGGSSGRAWRLAALGVLALAAGAASFSPVWNFDIFWHLAGGQWMFEHGRILGIDPFSIDPQPRWVNVHWLFQVIVTAVHAVGDFPALTVLKSVLCVASVLTLAWALRREVPAGWLVLSGLAMVMVMLPRIRIRPEVFTLWLLTLTMVLVDAVRRGAPARRLWWLVPAMLAWVNMHGLFVLGLWTAWSAVAGAWLDRRFRRPGGADTLLTMWAIGPLLAATAVCLVTPWPLETVSQPLLLWTRVSGQSEYYTYGVSELQPTWQVLTTHWFTWAVVVLAAVSMAANFRSVPAGHVLWLLPMLALALLARRNVGLLGPVCGFLLALHGGAALGRARRSGLGFRRLGAALNVACLVLAAVFAAGFATESAHRLLRTNQRFGAGLDRSVQAVGAAEFLRLLPARGDILCENFGDAGAFIYYCRNGRQPRRLWMDGRLEAHSLDRFKEQHRIRLELCSVASADRVALPPTVRFIVVRHDSRSILSALMQSRRFRLLHVDLAGAVFARLDYAGSAEGESWRPESAGSPVAHLDRPGRQDGSVEGTPVEPWRWWRQSPFPANCQQGAMLLSLAQVSATPPLPPADPQRHRCLVLAVRYLTAAQLEPAAREEIVLGSLAQACQQWALQWDVIPDPDVPVDVMSARALCLYRRLDLTKLDRPTMRMLALQQVAAMKQARQLDAARSAVEEIMAHLPPPQRVNPPSEYYEVRDALGRQLELVRAELRSREIPDATSVERARMLVQPQFGLIDQAIVELRGGPTDWPACVLLGDLLLAKGQVSEARAAYRRVPPPAGQEVQGRLREALCRWVEGDLPQAERELEEVSAGPAGQARNTACYYLSLLMEQAGRYDQARAALGSIGAAPENLLRLADQAARRLDWLRGTPPTPLPQGR